jgi:hypothetical protein
MAQRPQRVQRPGFHDFFWALGLMLPDLALKKAQHNSQASDSG